MPMSAADHRVPRLPHHVAKTSEAREGNFQERAERARAIEDGMVEWPAEEQRERPRALGRSRDGSPPADRPFGDVHRHDEVEVVHAEGASLRGVDVTGDRVEIDSRQGDVNDEVRSGCARGGSPMDDRQQRRFEARLLELCVDRDLSEGVPSLADTRLHVEDGGLDVAEMERHPARTVVPDERTAVDEHLLPEGRRPDGRLAVGGTLEDLPQVHGAVGPETRVEDWSVEDHALEHGAPFVESAQ